MQFHARAFFQRFFHADSQGQKLLSEFEPCASLKLNSKMVKKKKDFGALHCALTLLFFKKNRYAAIASEAKKEKHKKTTNLWQQRVELY